jgi:hypothetical protein
MQQTFYTVNGWVFPFKSEFGPEQVDPILQGTMPHEGAHPTAESMLNAPHINDIWGEQGVDHPGIVVPGRWIQVHDFGPIKNRVQWLPEVQIVPKIFPGQPDNTAPQSAMKAIGTYQSESHK